MPIIDTHHHLWDDKQRGRYLIHELAEDTGGAGHNIVATVFIETGSMFRADGPPAMQCIGEVEFVNGVAAMSASGQYGKARHCAGIVGAGDMALGDAVQPVLEGMIAAGNGRLRGIRFGTSWDGTDSTNLRPAQYAVPPIDGSYRTQRPRKTAAARAFVGRLDVLSAVAGTCGRVARSTRD